MGKRTANLFNKLLFKQANFITRWKIGLDFRKRLGRNGPSMSQYSAKTFRDIFLKVVKTPVSRMWFTKDL